MRPSLAEVERALEAGEAVISHRGADATWVELLASGLTFDLTGLSPGVPETQRGVRHHYGLPTGTDASGLELLALKPGPHLASAGAMLPVLRVQCALALALGEALSVVAYGYTPPATLIGPEHFARTVRAWLDGGAFPVLGLTALVVEAGGATSEGLTSFVGREIEVPATGALDPASAGKLAIRVIDQLVRQGPVAAGERVSASGATVRVAQGERDDAWLIQRID